MSTHRATKQHAVVIAGSGATGLMLAGELALAGVDVAIVERRADQSFTGSRALGLNARTLELLDQRGIVDRFLAAGAPMQTYSFATRLDISDFPTRHNYGLALRQIHTERLLAEWVRELGVPTYRSREIVGFEEYDTHVDVALSNGESIRGRYLAGCDGGRSVVRKAAGIEFPGWDASVSWMIAEADLDDDAKWGFHSDALGIHAIGKSENGKAGIVLVEPTPDQLGDPTIDELRTLLVDVYGTDFGLRNATFVSRFNDATRQAARYRKGRILLAGDAANIRAPLGGQGLNLGMQDAVNLGWKLAQVVNGVSPDSLLDTYHAERHAAVARVLRNTMAHVALRRTDERTTALNDTLGELLRLGQPRKALGGLLSGLDVHYEMGAGHPLIGRRMPDLDVVSETGPTRVFSLMHDARPLLLDFGEATSTDDTPWAGRIRTIGVEYRGNWELPVIGEVDAPRAVLVRPDGHVAWTPNAAEPLEDALARWFGDY